MRGGTCCRKCRFDGSEQINVMKSSVLAMFPKNIVNVEISLFSFVISCTRELSK